MLKIRHLTKHYGSTTAVDRLDLEIHEGEFFTLLGPSGCGKTTTMRCVAGLEKPEEGFIELRGRQLVNVERGTFVAPERREMGMVFQSYALWPHMTVFENVAYPLMLRRAPKATVRQKVLEVLRLVGLEGYQDRQAPQLSGGQQQRVALARALVFSPQVLLLDEPLSNLDALLRDEMRRQLKDLQRRVGVTTIFVTHDQVEALSLSDRIAIMNMGQLEQVGPPGEVYTRPATRFVQDFLGRTFTVRGRVVATENGTVQVTSVGGDATGDLIACSPGGGTEADDLSAGKQVLVTIRPEHIDIHSTPPDHGVNVLPAEIRSALFIGNQYEYVVDVAGSTQVLPLPSKSRYDIGGKIYLQFPESATTVWPA